MHTVVNAKHLHSLSSFLIFYFFIFVLLSLQENCRKHYITCIGKHEDSFAHSYTPPQTEVSVQLHILADLHLVKVPLFNPGERNWGISDQYELSSKGKVLYPSRESNFEFPSIQLIVSVMNGPSVFCAIGLYVFFILRFRFIRFLSWDCLTTLLVAHIVQSDWKVKHSLSEREFGLSAKLLESDTKHNTRDHYPLKMKRRLLYLKTQSVPRSEHFISL
jgi:hypothetical protein